MGQRIAASKRAGPVAVAIAALWSAAPGAWATDSISLSRCTAQQSCGVEGRCVQIDQSLVLAWMQGASSSRYFALGPLAEGAGGGLLFEVSTAETQAPDLAAVRAAMPKQDDRAILLARQTDADVEDDLRERVYVLRPARELDGIGGQQAVTEFYCNQVLF